MRIYITGAHGVGKSTTIKLLRRVPFFRKMKLVPSAREKIKAAGLTHSENATALTQELYMNHCLEHSDDLDNIFDRCVIDVMAYTAYLYYDGRIEDDLFKEHLNVIDEFNKKLGPSDFVFFIRPEFPLPDDGWRSSNVDLQKKVDENIQDILMTFKIPHITLHGNPYRRVFQIVRTTITSYFKAITARDESWRYE